MSKRPLSERERSEERKRAERERARARVCEREIERVEGKNVIVSHWCVCVCVVCVQ